MKSHNCPRIDTVIKAHKLLDGWTILEKILRKIMVSCGGRPSDNLDVLRTTLTFEQNESYVDFYIRTQNILNEYHLRYNNLIFIPIIQITSRFIHQLNRAKEYTPVLTRYIDLLEDHIDRFGEVDNRIDIGFTLNDVFEYMEKMKVSVVPKYLTPEITSVKNCSKLRPSPDNKDDLICSFTSDSLDSGGNIDAMIASLSGTIVENCTNPVMCAAMRANNKSRCQACLLGFHDEVKCFLRGPHFQPEALKRRIRIYNQLNGDRPPKGHEPRIYEPGPKNAIHTTSTDRKQQRNHQPFRNYKTKNPQQQKHQSINSLEIDNDNFDIDDYLEDDDRNQIDVEGDQTISPVINAFIKDQSDHALNFTPIDDGSDTFAPRICSYQIQDNIHLQGNNNETMRKRVHG